MPWFQYRQNNSGGSFIAPAIYVIVEAKSAKYADFIATEEAGIYFGGVSSERDCPCCGDRWYNAGQEGDPEPSIYGQPVAEYLAHSDAKWDKRWASEGNIPIVILYHADGKVTTYGMDGTVSVKVPE